jgi:hypothetical protein
MRWVTDRDTSWIYFERDKKVIKRFLNRSQIWDIAACRLLKGKRGEVMGS